MIDVLGRRRWAFPLVVIGMNSIAAYCIHGLLTRFLEGSFTAHVGEGAFRAFGESYAPFLLGVAVLLAQWLMLLWMWRRRLFLRI